MGLDINFHRVKREDIGSFRKVNFLVGFFEDQTGEEIPNCQGVRITREMCEELLNRCNKVLEDHSKAEELLPTYPGFFFGSYEYDEYYFDDVEAVRDYCKDELIPQFDNLDSDEDIEFYIWY